LYRPSLVFPSFTLTLTSYSPFSPPPPPPLRSQGYNQLSELALLSTVDINNYILDKDVRRRVSHAVEILREKCELGHGIPWFTPV